MTRPLVPFLLLSATLLSATLPANLFAQTARGYNITGHVYLGDNAHPAQRVTVTVENAEHEFILNDVTGEHGEFRITGLTLAQYFVIVQLQDYLPFSQEVDLSFESATGLDIYLRPVNEKRETPPVSSVSVHELSMPVKARELVGSGKQKLYQQKDASGAISDFQQALDLAPGYFEASYQLGVAYLTLNNPSAAESAFRKSVESSGSTYAEAEIRLGSLLLDHSNSEGEKFIRKGIQLDPNSWLGHYELGRALFNQKRLPEALESAEKARLLAPSVPLVYRLLSNIHLLQKDYPALLEDLDTYISLDPDSPAGQRAKKLREQLQKQQLPSEQFAPAHP